MKNFFQKELNPQKIIKNLSVYLGKPIDAEHSLLFFDEVQTSAEALNSLKYFAEEASEYFVIAAGSLLGVTLSNQTSFHVGKVNFLSMYPMSFLEFLDAMGAESLRKMLEALKDFSPIAEPIHEKLIEYLKQYYFVGGMPEAVSWFSETEKVEEMRKIQNEILRAYTLDFAKHASKDMVPKLLLIWEMIPKYLARENKKFVFSKLKKGARAREFEESLMWLDQAGLVHRVFGAETVQFPLKHYEKKSIFKVYALDVGLLGALSQTSPSILVRGHALFKEFKGAFIENYAIEQLTSLNHCPPQYWKSKSGTAEVDALVEQEQQIFPLEIKAGINLKSKSLGVYKKRYQPKAALRTTLLNFQKNDDIINIPLYAISELPRLLNTLL